jgi:hypothetical protein
MPPQHRRYAKHRRQSDGAALLRVEGRLFVDLDEAATALALVYQGQPVREGLHSAQVGLVQAGHDRVLESVSRRESADPDLVAAYRAKLLGHGVFPDPDRDPDAPAPEPTQTKRIARYKRADGTPLLRVDVPTHLDISEAATALALVYSGQPVRFGLNGIQVGLVEAVRDRVLERPDAYQLAAAGAVADYKRVLINLGVFPDPDAPTDPAGSDQS